MPHDHQIQCVDDILETSYTESRNHVMTSRDRLTS